MVGGLTAKEQEETFGGDGNSFCLDCGGDNTTIY